MKDKQIVEYVTKQRLRRLGLTWPDREMLALWESVNNKIGWAVDREIRSEIEHNYNNDLLDEYAQLVETDGINAPTTQEWVKSHIAAIDEIVTDRIEIMLYDLKVAIMKIDKVDV